jgi:hypothetical protein
VKCGCILFGDFIDKTKCNRAPRFAVPPHGDGPN